MSQERTERWTDREIEKDRRVVASANAEIKPGVLRVDSNWLIQFVNIATHYINLSEQRREERDSNQRLHIQSLEEIDRLNATIAGQAEAIREQTHKAVKFQQEGLRLGNENIALTAKVQERDKEIERLKSELESALSWGREQRQAARAAKQAWYDALPVTFDGDATTANMRAEIERLRAVGEHIIYEAVRMSENDWDEPSIAFEEEAKDWRAALKGAE